jgi:hypothetical protein
MDTPSITWDFDHPNGVGRCGMLGCQGHEIQGLDGLYVVPDPGRYLVEERADGV